MPNDPTKTAKLRQSFRGEVQRRIRTLLTATQDMLVEQNAMMNPSHPMMLVSWFARALNEHAGAQLDVFTRWFNGTIYQTVGGDWINAHAERAFRHGLNTGKEWTKVDMVGSVDKVFFSFYKNELEGIMDATSQQVTRAISTGLLNRESGRVLYRRVVAVTMKVTEPRLYMLGHQVIVQQHNRGILAQLKAAGHTHVGVIPETRPRKVKQRSDGIRDDEEVNILTAGDDAVCEECQDYADGGPYEIDEVESTLPLHVACRCEWTPTTDLRFAINTARTVAKLLAEE